MTVINMFCQPRGRAGYIVADTAVLDYNGIYVESCSKVAISLGRFPFAIGMTGNIHPKAILPVIGAADCKTLKQLIKRFPDMLHDAVDVAAKTLGDIPPSIAFKAVAWNFAKNRPMGLQIANDRLAMPDHDPFQLYEVAFSLSLHDEAQGIEQLIGGADPTEPGQFDAEMDGLRLIEAQRANGTRTALPGAAESRCTVGGEAQLYKITKHGVTCYSLREWPDTLGSKLKAQA